MGSHDRRNITMQQLSLLDFEIKIENKLEEMKQAKLLPLESYDHIIISASAGKDSMACCLNY